MVQVNVAYKNGRSEKKWLESLRIIFSVGVFAPKDGQEMATGSGGQMNTTDYPDQCLTHKDQTYN